MMTKTTRTLASAIAGLAIGAVSTAALASGPLNLNFNDPDNVERWPNGGAGIPYNPDQGGLGPLNNAQAVAEVEAAYQRWQDIPTASQTYVNAGPMPVDVDVTNYAPFLPTFFGTNPNVPDGLSPIVFDEDGAIFEDIFGPGTGVLGFATPDIRDANGIPLEGNSFLNGGSIIGGFPLADFLGVIFHEFGHYSGLGHTVVNGQNIILGDQSGPTPFNDFGDSPGNQTETMFPFALIGGGQVDPHADDIAFISFLYPDGNYFDITTQIAGTIRDPAGNPITGVNVIARNVADPFVDAVSAISGDLGITGEYTIRNLTPGADYVVFVDQILQGGFSTPPLQPLPGVEEYYNGANESNSSATDAPNDFVTIAGAAGTTTAGIDVIFNTIGAGDDLNLGDDDSVELFLPFAFSMCGVEYNSVFVNSNGNLTFGAGDTAFFETAFGFLFGPPRIAGLWDDLNPTQGGTVFFTETDSTFTVNFVDVPEFFSTGANTFSITLRRSGNRVDVSYDGISALDGFAGISCGGQWTSIDEAPVDLSALADRRRGRINSSRTAATGEQFGGGASFDLDGRTLTYSRTRAPADVFEPNNTFGDATPVALPFDTSSLANYTSILPAGNDVDYFEFTGSAGDSFTGELVRGQRDEIGTDLDTIIGLFDASGTLIALDDDGQGTAGGLSIIEDFPLPADGTYYVAVSTWPDFDFDGVGGIGCETPSGSCQGRYVLELSVVTPPPGVVLPLGDDDFEEVALPFAFPFNGANYGSMFVNSNGSVSFGAGDTDFSESEADLFNGPPRIAMMWDDLSPNQGGFVTYEDLGTSARVNFIDVPQFFSGDSNNFSVEIFPDGSFTVTYGSLDLTDGLAGTTEGNGTAGNPQVDLSSSPTWSAVGTTHELFPFGTNDLALSTLDYLP